MTALADEAKVQPSRFKVGSELADRILRQAARELLLAESSDWAFQIYQGTTVQYSTRRFESHIQRFNILVEMLEAEHLSDEQNELLSEIERRDNIFPEIDWRVYCS